MISHELKRSSQIIYLPDQNLDPSTKVIYSLLSQHFISVNKASIDAEMHLHPLHQSGNQQSINLLSVYLPSHVHIYQCIPRPDPSTVHFGTFINTKDMLLLIYIRFLIQRSTRHTHAQLHRQPAKSKQRQVKFSHLNRKNIFNRHEERLIKLAYGIWNVLINSIH